MTSPLDHLDDAPGSSSQPPSADPAATAVSIACPGCRRLVPVGTPCRSCGRTASPTAVARDLTVVLDPAPDDTLEMEAVPPATPPPAPQVPPVPGRSRELRGRAAGVLGGAAALVLVATAAVAGLHSRSGGDGRTASVGSSRPATSAAAVATGRAVPAGSVHASASTTQHPDGSISYAAANTLDGRPATAWNSDGQGPGATLTYTFAAPVDLTSITVLNGYQKVLTGSGGRTVDLYALNQRVKAVRVVTDAGSAAWTLRDDPAPQSLARAFGRTRSVRLEVLSTYPGRKYRDLAVSEVRFTAKG